jgi:sulfite exporter TauE/SafE/copper chaperone CopZ
MTKNLSSQDVKTLVVNIRGMHCTHCEVAIERKLAAIPGVHQVDANFRNGTARMTHIGDLNINALQRAVTDEGYTVVSWDERSGSTAQGRNTARDFAEIGAAFLILVGIVLLVRQFSFQLHGFVISDNLGYGIAFVIGLVASVSSCMAVTGGLLVALAAKYNAAYSDLTGIQRLKPHIFFNVGRVVSYALLGGAIGALGSALTLSVQATSVLTIAASVVMIVLGLQMLKVFPSIGKLLPVLPKSVAHRIHDFRARNTSGGAFLLGALTFFLPCGFTQALQLYVLTKGSFATGALTMLAFALGTLPALLSLSALSSFASGGFQRHFLRFAGAAVIVLGFFNIQYGLVLAGSSIGPIATANPPQYSEAKIQAPPVGEKQNVEMRIDGFEYIPNRFVVKQGVPVEWRIDGRDAAGCGRILIAPRLGIRRLLSGTGITIINFTPELTGDFAFNCGMGMMTPNSKFTVVRNADR